MRQRQEERWTLSNDSLGRTRGTASARLHGVGTDDVWSAHVENQIVALLSCLNEHYVEPPIPADEDD